MRYTVSRILAGILALVMLATFATGAYTIVHNATTTAPHMSLCNANHTDCYGYCIIPSGEDQTAPRDARLDDLCVNGCSITVGYAVAHDVLLYYAHSPRRYGMPNVAAYFGSYCVGVGRERMPDGTILNGA